LGEQGAGPERLPGARGAEEDDVLRQAPLEQRRLEEAPVRRGAEQRLPVAAGQLQGGGHSQQREDVNPELGGGRGGHLGLGHISSRGSVGQGPSEARALTLLVVLAVLPLVLGLGNEVWYGDPSQYAEVARRIAVSGDWLHLFDNNGPNLNKPPLAMWGIALFVKLLGPTSEAIRLPALLFGVVMLIAVARIGTLLWSRSAGLCAAALLASSLAFQVMVGDPKVDMALTAMSACAVWMAFEARRRPWTIWLAWLFGGLGVLAKGPIGLVAPVAAVLPEAIRHQWGDAGPGTLRSRLWRLQPLGLLVAAAVVYP